MKICLLFFLMVQALNARTQEPLNVMTFNIRYNTFQDSLNAWPYRKDKVVSQILYHEAKIIGVQEALSGQLEDMLGLLKKYAFVGSGRDDGKQKGEFSAIFFDTTRLQLIDHATFWLSETPDIPGSKGWDAALPRIVTWASFKDLLNGKIFYHFNTHFDHMGKLARIQSAALLLQKITLITGEHPVVVTGDFNAKPEDDPMLILTDKNNPEHLTDAKTISGIPHHGPEGTFNGWKINESPNPLIDYIYIKHQIKVEKHATLAEIWGTRFSSDHFPVFASLIF